MKRLILVPLLLSGCLASTPKKSVNLNSVSLTSSASDLKSSMTLSNKELQSDYSVDAFLYTDTYIELNEKEKGLKNMDDQKKIDQNILSEKKAFTNNKTCILLSTSSFDINKTKSNAYVLKLQDSDLRLHDMYIQEEKFLPDHLTSASSYMVSTTYYNSFISCVDKKINLENEIKLFVIPQLKSDAGMAEKSELTWSFQK